MMVAEQNIMSAMMQRIDEQFMDDIIKSTIPIYTMKRPNPKSGQADCPITKREKKRFQLLMKEKLEKATTEQERQKVIDHYKDKWSE